MNMPPLIPPFDFQTHILGPWATPDIAAGTGWTIAAGALAAVSCGPLGCPLLVQRLALLCPLYTSYAADGSLLGVAWCCRSLYKTTS